MNGTLLWIVVTELVFIGGTILHANYFNGSPYFELSWRRLNYLRTTIYLAIPLIPYLYCLFKIERVKDEKEAWKILLLLMASNFLFQIMGIAAEPQSFELVNTIVISRRTTSFFYDANEIKNIFFFLANYHTLDLRAHSSSHPPGPILYWYLMIRMFGADLAAYIGGFMIAVLATVGIPVLYAFSSLWTRDPKTRLTVCAFYALIPGLILFFPVFDQIYPIFSMLMIYFWELSLSKSRYNAIYFGLSLFIATFFAYNLLVMGVFHVLSAIAFILSDANMGKRFRILTSASVVRHKFLDRSVRGEPVEP